MARDVLQDLVSALCSLGIVEPPCPRRGAGGMPAQSSAPPKESRDAATQEAA